ncbi:MAG: tetratricopeptide repeat protein [Immundisolibacterales bacterium]|nr:tetratricopeptide repeat protein [Immundisolibacterales bacterium]
MVAAATGAPSFASSESDADASPPGSASEAAQVDAAFDAMVNDPADLEKTFHFAALAARTGDLEGAVAALERMLLLEPDLPRVKLELGVLYFRLGSYVVARRYLTEAVAGDRVPDEVRARVAEYVAAVDAKLARHHVSGFSLFGARYQSNANAGPSSPEVRLEGRTAALEDRFTGQSDADVFAAAGIEHRYDFRRVDGLKWVTDATLYATRQRTQEQVNLALVEARTGPERGFGRAAVGDDGLLVRPYAKIEHVTLDDRIWYQGAGAGVGLRFRPSDRLEVSGGADVVRRRHRQDAENPAADDRDGWVIRARLTGRHALTGAFGLRLTAGAVRHELKAEYEKHDDVELGAGLDYAFSDPSGFTHRRWTASVGLNRLYSRYDAPDDTIDPNRRRTQRALSAEASLTVPLGERLAVVLSVGDRDVDASLPNFTNRNRWASAAVAWSF